jgi:hypothetical protein
MRDEVEERNEKISRPKKPRFVRVFDEKGTEIPRAQKRRGVKDDDCVAILVIGRDDRVLRSLEWDLAKIERELQRAHDKGASDVTLARMVCSVGEDAGYLTNLEIREGLRRRDKARKK